MRHHVKAWLVVASTGILSSTAWADELARVAIRGEGDSAEITVEGDFAVPDYNIRARDEGMKLVIDIAHATLPPAGLATTGQNALVTSTTASSTAQGVRLELALTAAATYHARAEQGRIIIRLSGHEEVADAVPATASTTAASSVLGVHVERRDGRERVVIRLDGPAEFRVVPGTQGPARLELPGARLQEGAASRVSVDGMEVIQGVRVHNAAGRTVVEVTRPDGAATAAIREGNRIVWLFAPAETRDSRPRVHTIASRPAAGQPVGEDGTLEDEARALLADLPLQADGTRAARRYSGRRVDIDLKDADIHNVLRLLSEEGGVNVVTSDDVSGSVTIRMNNVPWDQALDVILQAKGLGMVRRGNMIRVAPQATLEKEREAAIARRRQQEQLAPLETRLIPVSYATADDLQARVRELLSGRGTVSVDVRTNTLITRDLVNNLDDVEELVRTLDTQTPQVLVEARIVEATSQYKRDVGIQWGFDGSMSAQTGNPTGLIFPSNFGIAGGNSGAQSRTSGLSPFQSSVATPNYAVNLPAITGDGQGGAVGMSFGSVGGNFNLNVRLSAAESSGTVRIISSPRILTLDNHEAHISQGTQIPYSQVSAQGVQTAFQQAKLELVVRPHVTSDGSISMHVKVTRDEPDFTRTGARGDPTILKREAETDLLVQDGHTAVIGGIYTRNTGHSVDQIPFFGDIPIIGLLFQRRRVQDDRNELLIFLTPRIVNRAEALRQ